MRYLVLALTLCCALAFVFAGCQKAPTDAAAGPVKASAKPAGSPKVADKATSETKTLTDPGGKKLILKSGGDTSFLKEAGVPEYPGATAYSIDLAASAKASGESMPESQVAQAEKVMKQVVLETSDPLEKIETWAKENLKDWTIKPIEERDGVKGFEASGKDEMANLMAFDYKTDDKRYIMIVDMSGMLKAMTEAMGQIGSESGKAMGGATAPAPADAPKTGDKAPAKKPG